MYKILEKKTLNSITKKMVIDAPEIASKAQPGQFIMLRIDENGERIPLTISDYDGKKGTVSIVFQEVGKTTIQLGKLNEGDSIRDFAGPLGNGSELEAYNKIAVIGGGLGTAIAFPQAKMLKKMGKTVHGIIGFRNKDMVILEEEMSQVCDQLVVATDDGSYKTQGFVTDCLKQQIEAGNEYDLVIAIGPLIMMKMVAKLTELYNIKTIVSMNTIMIDGTGMCGGCRVTVGGQTKFACVDGPDFDGHLIDFETAMNRQKMYNTHEKEKKEAHRCRIGGHHG